MRLVTRVVDAAMVRRFAGFVAAHGTLLFAFPPNHTFAAIPLQAEPSCARPGGSCGDAAGIAREFAAALSG